MNAEIKEIVAREQVLRDEIDKIIAEIEVDCMSTLELKLSINAPLNEPDMEVQTYRCRVNDPDICANNSITKLVLHLKMVFIESCLGGKYPVYCSQAESVKLMI